MAVRRVRSERFAAERRASHRHDITVEGTINGKAVTIVDLSLTGAQAVVPASRTPVVDTEVKVFVLLDLEATAFGATVRSVRPDPAPTPDDAEPTVRVGLEFHPDQFTQQARLTLGLFAASARSRDELDRPAPPAPDTGSHPPPGSALDRLLADGVRSFVAPDAEHEAEPVPLPRRPR